jgi:hypothetical protein
VKHPSMKIKKLFNILIVVAVLAAMLIPAMPAQAAVQEFPLQLIGDTTVNILKADLAALADTYPSNTANDSTGNVFKGTALWRLIAKVDGGDPNTLNTAILGNYSITLTGLNSDLSDYVKTINAGSWSSAFTNGNDIQTENIFVANKVQIGGAGEFVELPLTKPTDSSKLWYPAMLNGTAIAGGGYKVGGLYKIELTGLPHLITISAGLNGSITPSGTGGVINVANGTSQTFTITPDSGYHIASLTVDNVTVAPLVSTYTFDNVTSNHSIAATFAVGTQNWPLQLIGASTLSMTKTDFESLAAAHPSNEYTDSSGNIWKGVALYRLIGMVDDGNSATFNDNLTSYYSIKLTAADGYSKTIAPSDYAANFVVANKVKLNGTLNWIDLPLTNPTNVSKLWYPLIDTGSGIAVNNMRVASLVKIELLNLPATYTISTSNDGHGTAMANPASVISGGSSTITITPNEGYNIATVTDNDTNVTELIEDGVYTLTNITANHTVSVTFSLNTTWTLQIINAGNTYEMTKSEFESFPAVTINVTDMHGTHDWTGVPLWKLAAKNDSDGNPDAFNETLAATNYSIKAVSTGTSPYIRCIGPTASGTTISHNDNLIIANKMDGSPLTSESAPLKVIGTGLISSRFVSQLASIELVYTVNISTTTNGAITPIGNTADKDGIVGVSIGSNQSCTITPDVSYHIASLTVDNVTVKPVVSAYTFDNVFANHTIAATFAAGSQDWPLQLIGASTLNMTKTDFESLAAAHPAPEYTDSSGNLWKGVALYRLIGIVDDGNPAAFNSTLTSYYSIKLTAADGYNKTIVPSDYASNFTFADNESVFIANKVMLNGTSTWIDLPLTDQTTSKLWYPLIDTGSGIAVKNLRVAALVKIELLNLPATYTISTGTDGHGTAVANPAAVASGASSVVTISPNEGYSIATVTDNETNVTELVEDGVYTLTNITANHTISVTFTLIPVVALNVIPPPGTITAGSTFEVVLLIDTNTAIRGWQTNIDFDHTKLIANSVTEGNFMKDHDTIRPVDPNLDNTVGHITNIAYAIIDAEDLSGPVGSGDLCTISFTAKENVTGLTTITPSAVIVSDVNGNTLPGVEAVGGELTIVPKGPPTFIVEMAAGWNTFSTPIALDPQLNTLGQIFSGKNVSVALGYDAETQAWFSLDEESILKPCQAIFVYMDNETSITLPVDPALTAPPSTQLYAGWNLVSLANLEAMDVDTALISVKNVKGGLTGYIQVVSPEIGNQTGWIYITGQPTNEKMMKPFEGYWVYMLNDGKLAGFSTTPLD